MRFTCLAVSVIRTGLITLALIGLISCSSLRFPGVYRLSILQGNIIDQKKVDQLKEGMSRRQVQFLMGTPLVLDTFNQDLWVYLYQIYKPNGDVVDKRLEVSFNDDKVVSFDGTTLPRTEEEIQAAQKKLEEAKAEYKKAIEEHYKKNSKKRDAAKVVESTEPEKATSEDATTDSSKNNDK